MDQSAILSDFPFSTAMMLSIRNGITYDGVVSGVRRFVEALGRPAVLYIKYAIVRDDLLEEKYPRRLVDVVGSQQIVSGMGEPPAIARVRHFRLAGFTSGCVCVAPGFSTQMLQAL